jgi:DNA-binding NarL/FixJ family response regulator
VIADDHAPSRLGVRVALEEGGFAVVGEAATGPKAVRLALAERPDACVLDVYMAGGGIAAVREITARLPDTVVVMLTVSTDEEDLVAAIQAGACGYLLKTMDPGRFPAALRAVLAGEAAIPRILVAPLLEEIRERASRRRIPFLGGRRVRLTPREWQVLDLMWDELPTREMAARLGISQVTVRRHISEILRKLEIPDRKTAVGLKRWGAERPPGGQA